MKHDEEHRAKSKDHTMFRVELSEGSVSDGESGPEHGWSSCIVAER